MVHTSKNELRPFIPLLIGRGKLARHLSHYLTLRSVPHEQWLDARRVHSDQFKSLILKASAVWLLVSDHAIEPLTNQIRELSPGKTILHSSAATEVKGALTLHPLQTFGPEPYSEESYRSFPWMFIKEEWQKAPTGFREQIQELLQNPAIEILNSERIRYHAYCVMMSNFPQLLWAGVENESAAILKNPHGTFGPILKQATQNFLEFGRDSVTGPLVRGDHATVQKHELAIVQSKLLNLYKSFVTTFSNFNTQIKETL